MGQRALNTLETTRPHGPGSKTNRYSPEPVLGKPVVVDRQRVAKGIDIAEGREDLRMDAIRGLFSRSLALTRSEVGQENHWATPVVEIPGDQRGLQIVRNSSEVFVKGRTVTESRIQIWQHRGPERKVKRERILEIRGQVDDDGEISNAYVSFPQAPTDSTVDSGRVFDTMLVNAGRAVSVVEKRMSGVRPLDTEALLVEKERDYQLLDEHLAAITFYPPDGQENNSRLRAFNDWLTAQQVQADVEYYDACLATAEPDEIHELSGDYEKAERAKRAIDRRIRLTSQPDTNEAAADTEAYMAEHRFLTMHAPYYHEVEFDLMLTSQIPSQIMDGENGDVLPEGVPDVIRIPRLRAEARRKMVKSLRDRQERIASGDISVEIRPGPGFSQQS